MTFMPGLHVPRRETFSQGFLITVPLYLFFPFALSLFHYSALSLSLRLYECDFVCVCVVLCLPFFVTSYHLRSFMCFFFSSSFDTPLLMVTFWLLWWASGLCLFIFFQDVGAQATRD